MLPDAIAYLMDDATGDGLSLNQLAKDELSNLLEVGRAGFLVDYPQSAEGLSAEDVSALELRASIVPYTAEQVINWKADLVAGRKLLTMDEARKRFDGLAPYPNGVGSVPYDQSQMIPVGGSGGATQTSQD
jgi:hypothetical protein